MAAILSVGTSEGARMFTASCRACGHKMSLHTHTSMTPTVAVSAPQTPAEPVDLLAIPDTVSDKMLAQRLREAEAALAAAEAKATQMDARGKQRQAEAARRRAAALLEDVQRYAEATERRRLRRAPEPSAAAAPAVAGPAGDLAAQLARLADLHASGVLSDAEFTAAKTRLLS